MTTKRTLILVLALALVGLAVGLLAYPRMPAQVPSHWNIAGEVDGWTSRETTVWLLPVTGLGMGLLLLFLPNIDPMRANVEKFRRAYNWFVAGFAVFLLFIQLLVILAGLGVRFNMMNLLAPSMAALMVGIGFLLERTQQNWFLGIRTPWTLSSPVVWEKTHRLGARLFKLCGALILIGLVLPPQGAFLLIIGLVLTVTVVAVVYSYIAFREERQRS